MDEIAAKKHILTHTWNKKVDSGAFIAKDMQHIVFKSAYTIYIFSELSDLTYIKQWKTTDFAYVCVCVCVAIIVSAPQRERSAKDMIALVCL